MRTKALAARLPHPRRAIPILATFCAIIFVAYLSLVVATIIFASRQTNLSLSIRDAESRIGNLETSYYDAIGKISDADVASLGYRAPAKAAYVSAEGSPTVTLAPTATATH